MITAELSSETGACVADGKCLLFGGNTHSFDPESIERMADLARLIDSSMPEKTDQWPTGENWHRLCEILQEVPEGRVWGARFGIGKLWDVRLEVSAYGTIVMDRVRQGLLQSNSAFWV